MVNVVVAIGGVMMTGSTPMTAALHYLGRITDALFETQMRRAALRIGTQQLLFPQLTPFPH